LPNLAEILFKHFVKIVYYVSMLPYEVFGFSLKCVYKMEINQPIAVA